MTWRQKTWRLEKESIEKCEESVLVLFASGSFGIYETTIGEFAMLGNGQTVW